VDNIWKGVSQVIDRGVFEQIKRKHGHYASWAVWADGSGKPKDGVGDLSLFDIERDDRVLGLLHSRFVLVGLNISRGIQCPLGNFHDPRSVSMDYKIRHALRGTPLWGSYMTDIIKDFEQKASGKVMSYLGRNRDFERRNVEAFREELGDLASGMPTVVAFGNDAHRVVARNLGKDCDVWKLPHYSKYVGSEDYRREVVAVLGAKCGWFGKAV
jgi:hypothetical protein